MNIESFLDYLRYEKGYSSHTVEAYKRDLTQFCLYINIYTDHETFDPRLIDSDLIRNWIMSLLEEKMTATSANRKLSSLKSYFRYLIEKGVIDKNPARLVTGPKNKPALPVFMKEKELAELLDGDMFKDDFTGVRDRLLLELLYETGIRRSELTGLQHSDVDIEARQLKVLGKRNKQRLIPFGERIGEMLKTYIEVKREAVANDNGCFFVRKDGSPLSVNIVYYIVNKWLGAISTTSKRSPHVLRHTFATSLLNDGAELDSVKQLLGHSSLAATSVYTHLTFNELKKMYHAHPRAQK